MLKSYLWRFSIFPIWSRQFYSVTYMRNNRNITQYVNSAKKRERENNDDEFEAQEQNYTNFLLASGLSLLSQNYSRRSSKNVLIVHPRIRWGENVTPKFTTAELQLEEAVSLCQTLPFFNVVGTVIIGTDYNTKKKLIWGEGRLEKLKSLKLQTNATVIMINTKMLTPLQQSELSSYFGVPIYDRYNVVLCIFKMFARTREAHLQISLAEIPYIRHRLRYMCNKGVPSDMLHISDSTLDCGKIDEKFDALRLREHSLQKKIKEIVDAKVVVSERRTANDQPVKSCVIAIIGYTNVGKTTLVKSSNTIFGENRMFATLDTSTYNIKLPSGIRAVLADTIGFISDLPIELFASFSATLRHVIKADVLIHLQDLSHPNIIAQHETVIETLRRLKINKELVDTMIHVGNKVDRVSPEMLQQNKQIEGLRTHSISCRTGEGIRELIYKIDLATQRINGSKLRRFRLLPTSRSIHYLYENNLVSTEPQISDCGKYLIFDVLMNDDQVAKFQANLTLKLKQKNG